MCLTALPKVLDTRPIMASPSDLWTSSESLAPQCRNRPQMISRRGPSTRAGKTELLQILQEDGVGNARRSRSVTNSSVSSGCSRNATITLAASLPGGRTSRRTCFVGPTEATHQLCSIVIFMCPNLGKLSGSHLVARFCEATTLGRQLWVFSSACSSKPGLVLSSHARRDAVIDLACKWPRNSAKRWPFYILGAALAHGEPWNYVREQCSFCLALASL
ncbi:hypothetical protein LIA77_07487 [Sarocladium implicatum]|nr:hypothetical protein LIA77_07487 [Sarocladium implicatum]